MHDDVSLAALLGEPPQTPDPGFRFDVFARMAERARRRAALERGALQVAAFTAIGLILALIQFGSVAAGAWGPMLACLGALVLTAAVAFTVIRGPKAALAVFQPA